MHPDIADMFSTWALSVPFPHSPYATFWVPGLPIAQPRQRQRVIKTKSGAHIATNYTPRKDPVNQFKASILMSFQMAYRAEPKSGPVALSMLYVMRRTRPTRKTMPNPAYWHEVRPDLDNLEKSVKDSLSGLAYRDDAQVALVSKMKIGAKDTWQPGLAIMLATLDPLDEGGAT